MGDLIKRMTAWALSLKPVRVLLHYSERRGPMLADSVTYRTLFSVFAGVLLGFSFVALWLSGNPQAMDSLVRSVDAAIPGLVGPDGVVDVSEIDAPAGFTVAGIIALVALVGASIGAIGSLRNALRTLADDVHDDMMFLWVILRNLALALAIGGGFVLTAGATFAGTAFAGTVLDWLGISREPVADLATRAVSILVVFALDMAVIALAFVSLSGVRAHPRSLWSGAFVGAVGLIVLQQLSGLFIGGADTNPLLASFASLIALLIWLNLSAHVMLLAGTWVIVGERERVDRVRERHGSPTFAIRRVRQAEDAAAVAAEELRLARKAAAAERADARAAAKEDDGSDDDSGHDPEGAHA
ncbi:YihY/virulence factor BrkB family protein [Microbacterium sp. HD4P20]|uniref:YihY/virulence factor BrkB family protein n=1 Tax=Microbacterium sp. HD4P20 TaxID=2864874 RepID=UPI001C63C571|nr:YihY/virulence factor BrkB family protein [Microbacterium sp. HD4P20]MCP2637165.1 YihY/virulence factor BrkB family protein [Microbacterium sp. HD4P20]